MYKIRTTPKAEARQMEFQETLLGMLKNQKLEDITVSSLCKEMNISRKTFYQYYDGVEDVLHFMIDKELRNGFLNLEIVPDLRAFLVYWKSKRPLLDILEKSGLSYILMERAYYLLYESRAQELYSSTFLKHAGQITAILTVLIMWHHGGMKQSVDEMEALGYEMFHITRP